MKTVIWIAGILFVIAGLFTYLVASWNTVAMALSAAGLLFLAVWSVLFRRELKEALKRKQLLYGVNLVILVAVVLGLIVVVNYASSDYYERWDLTSGGRFTLSRETDSVLKQLRGDLRITAFFQEGTSANIRNLLAEYTYRSKKIHEEIVDPDKEPTIARSYGITANGTVVLQYAGKTIKTQQADENGITNAVIKLLRNRIISVCYITGHGERDLSDTTGENGYGDFKQALIDQDYRVEPLLLPSVASVPTACTIVMDAGAVKPFLPEELAALKAYIAGGGYLLIMTDPRTHTGMPSFLARYGIDIGNNVVLDQVVRLFQGPGLGVEPMVTSYGRRSAITRDFKGTTIFPLVSTVEIRETNGRSDDIVPIAQTSKTSWADADLKDLFAKGSAKFGPGDIRGPVDVAVAGTIQSGGKTARLAVFGTSRIMTNKYINALFNKDLVMNTVSWLAKEENLITIRPKTEKNQEMFLTAVQGNSIFYTTVILIPVLLFFGGILAYIRMRKS